MTINESTSLQEFESNGLGIEQMKISSVKKEDNQNNRQLKQEKQKIIENPNSEEIYEKDTQVKNDEYKITKDELFTEMFLTKS